ncbi:hypothetical protein HPG69_016513 [Diceros bicornis minor]|uniref:Uncharacterized protein n=1 Tax=Diceros bicornis minor TaxID=77932 RepID=A0A7J7F511_DICBM|nr:hypothetical protein HPG69_016513 [Diceros bicornis minor]
MYTDRHKEEEPQGGHSQCRRRETMQSDAAEGERCRGSKCDRPWGSCNALHVTGVLHTTTSRISRIVTTGKEQGPESAPKGQAPQRRPDVGHGPHLTTCRDPMCDNRMFQPSCAGRSDEGD